MKTIYVPKFRLSRMFVDILSIVVILAMAFPATGSAYAEESTSFSGRDEFDGSLADGWYWVNENEEKWEFNNGSLRIYASPYGAGGENLLLRPVAQGDFMIKTQLVFEPDTNFQFAGLVIWQDQYNFLQLGRAFCDIEGACVGNGLYFDRASGGESVDGNFATSIGNPSDVSLRLERRGDMVRAFYSADHGISWYEIGTHWIPSDFQVNGVGLTASQDSYTPDWDIPADFDFFELTEGSGFLPEGFHDGEQGEVPSWACNANGWATDPDDRVADVNVEIVVDDQTVTTLPAGEFRQDLADANVCEDGNCSFSTSLWDVISSYEPHNVDTWAQDTTSGEWVLLSNSDKTLTCRTYDIYTYDPTTGVTKQVTDLRDTHEFNPRWSPDAKTIVHDTWSTDWSSHGVYLTTVQTGVTTPLAGAQGGSYPTWSPSGKWIAFDRGADNDFRVFIVRPTGGDPKLVAEDAFMATWSPRSNRLAFHRPSDGGIWTTDLDGENQTKVAERGNGPAWSPDGEWIAFEVDGDVWKIRVSNSGAPLGDPIQLTSSPLWEGRPTWSFNSQTIAFHAGMGQDTDIWTIPAAGGMATWLTGAPNFGDYDANYSLKGRSSFISYSSFSPDGQAARTWISNFSYEVGTWTEGEHDYYFETTYSVPQPWSGVTDPITFNVTPNALTYNGYVLLRAFALRARVGSGCPAITPLLNPAQNTRFSYGWLTDFPMTYAEALDHFNSMVVQAHWDDGMSADLQRQEIFSSSAVDFNEIVCASTQAPPEPDLGVMTFPKPNQVFGYGWPVGSEVSLHINGQYIATVNVAGAPWDENDIMAFFDFGAIHDLVAGDVVVLSGSGLQSMHIVENLAVTAVNVEPDTVSGTADPGADVHAWVHGIGRDVQVNATDGSWDAYFGADDFHLQRGMCGRAEILDLVGNSTNEDWCVPNTRFTVWPEQEYLEGYEWPDGAVVSISVAEKDVCSTEVVPGYPEWDPNNTFFSLNFAEGCDIAAGDLITLSSEQFTFTHQVGQLAVTDVNLDANTVTGTAVFDPQQYMLHTWIHGVDGSYMQLLTEDGTWAAEFGFELQPGMGGRVELVDQNTNATAVEWHIPNPHFSVFPEWDYIEGWEWPDGALVTAVISGKPQCDAQGTSAHPNWDPNSLFVSFWLPDGCDVAVTDVVTLTDGVTTREYTVQNLAITAVDVDANTITGTADAGTTVHVWPHGYNELLPTADSDGNWTADFTESGPDLVPGMGGRTEVRDEIGNATAVEWRILNPFIEAAPFSDWIHAREWPIGTVMTLEIDDPANGLGNVDYTATETMQQAPWNPTDPNDILADFRWPDELVPGPGYVLTMSGDGQSKTLTISSLSVTSFDLEADTISGTGTPSSQIQVCANLPDRCITRWVTADENGNWTANYAVPGTGSDDPDTFDVQPWSNGWAAEYESDSDRTWFDWWVPNPRFVVFPEWEWFDGNDWPDGATVNITVEGKDECTTSKVSEGFFFNGSFGEGCDVVIGDEVTFSDGTTTRSHIVRNLAVTAVDSAANTVTGTSDAHATVYVWQHEPGEQIPVEADENGEWFADLNGYYDIQLGSSGRSEIRDELGNATAVDWYVPYSRIVASITEDWFNAQEFAPNTELDFAVYAGAGGTLIWQGTTPPTDDSGFVWIDAEGRWDLEPGNYITVSDGTAFKDLVIEGFTFDLFDATNGHLEGTAPEPFGRIVWVGIGLQENSWFMDATTDLNGHWSADFGAPVPSDYQWVAAQIFDEDGDSTELRPASQILFLRPSCGDTYTAQPNIPLELRYGSWLARGQDLAAQNAEHLSVELVLDGAQVTGLQQPVVPGSEIPCGTRADAYGVFYVAQLEGLSPGPHSASVSWILDAQVTDGYDSDGDGEPDWYGPGVVATYEFMISVP